MRTGLSNALLVGLLIGALSVGGCPKPNTPDTSDNSTQVHSEQPNPSDTPIQAQPKRMKKVEVSIDPLGLGGGSVSTSFEVGPNWKPIDTDSVKVYWNGYGFICKDDTGEKFWQYSNDLAFANQQAALFTIRKKINVTDESGSTTVSASTTVKVIRGVPATF